MFCFGDLLALVLWCLENTAFQTLAFRSAVSKESAPSIEGLMALFDKAPSVLVKNNNVLLVVHGSSCVASGSSTWPQSGWVVVV